MKATMRRSGERRFTFKIQFSIGRDDLTTLIARGEGIDNPTSLTRTAVLRMMRERLALNGAWSCGALDHVPESDITAAEAVIDRLFPELIVGQRQKS